MCLQYTHNVGYVIVSFRGLFMVHCQAAHRPDHNRVSECVALKLFKEYKEARNRPKDTKGRTFAIPQSIVMTYSHVKQLIEDCNQILQNSNLVLVTINNSLLIFTALYIYFKMKTYRLIENTFKINND